MRKKVEAPVEDEALKRGPGAPASLAEGQRKDVYLDAEVIAKALEIGGCNISEGLRVAGMAYRIRK